MKCLVLLFLAAALFCWGMPQAHAGSEPGERRPLWPGGAPGAKGDGADDTPTLQAYPLAQGEDAPIAVIVVPGGGYGGLADGHEGDEIARWLNENGIAAHILRYRHAPRYHHPHPKMDIQRAIRTVRAQGGPRPVGVIGFSAGGHLTATAATQFDAGNPTAEDPIERQSCRPDFVILGYPVITMEAPHTHQGSRNNLLADNQHPEMIRAMSAEKNVTPQSPPAFLFSSGNDPVVPVQNSILYYQACIEAGIPAEMHLYQEGPHGFGLAKENPALAAWAPACTHWIRLCTSPNE